MKAPICCKKFMELKAVIVTPAMGYDRMFFQCKKCGEIETESN